MKGPIFKIATAGAALTFGVSAQSGTTPGNSPDVPMTWDAMAPLVREVDVPKTNDPFTVSPAHAALADRVFSFDIPMRHNEVPGWNYDADAQILTLHPGSNLMASRNDLPRKFASAHGTLALASGYALLDEVTSKSEYVGTNAFGAMANVKSTARRRYGIIELGSRALVSTFDTFEVAAPPERARSLTTNIRLRVEGVVKPVEGQSVFCYNDLTEATFSNPNEELVRACLVSARITSVKVLDAATGDVLFDRLRQPDTTPSLCEKWQKELAEAQSELSRSRIQGIISAAACPAKQVGTVQPVATN